MNLIPCPLAACARLSGDSPAIISNKKRVSYSQLNGMSTASAIYLRHIGVKATDRIGICSETSIDFVAVLWALWRIGAVACLFSTRLPKEQLASQQREVDCERLIDPQEIVNNASACDDQDWSFDIDQEINIMFTSGSSTQPKAAMHTFGNHYFSAQGANAHIPIAADDRWLVSLLLYHVGGLSILFRTVLDGAAMVLYDSKKDISGVIEQYGITHISLVATQLARLANAKSDIHSLKAILVGGGAIPRVLLNQCARRGWPLYITYGLTEMSSQVATSPKNQFDCVEILKYRNLRISKEGEIMVKGEVLFKGYIQDNAMQLPLDKDGWFSTGDLGYWNEDGYLTITGRKDNMFISGGENIQPEEIEKYLLQHQDVEQSVVVPIPDKEFGLRPAAFIKMKKGASLQEKETEIRAHLQNHLPKFKIPKTFHPWPQGDDMNGLKLNRKYFIDFVLK